MKLRITKKHIMALLTVPALVLSMSAAPVFATNLSVSGGANAARGNDQSECLFGTEEGCAGQDKTPIFRTITNVLLFIIGAISVIMLIIGGIRYTTIEDRKSVV